MAKYVSGRQQNLKVGLSSYSENLTSIEVIGNVGIATTNATSKLYVVGDGYFTGVVTASNFSVGNSLVGAAGSFSQLNVSGITTLGVTSATNLTAQQLNVSGISTLGVTSTTNLTSQQLNVSGITTLGVTSTTNLTSQQLNVSGISTLGVTSTTNLTAQQLNVSGISTLGVTSATNLTAQQLNVSGITTLGVTSATNLTAQQLNVSGITTLGVVTSGNIYSTGVVTATTFSGTLSGFASSAGIATYATNAGIATYATNAGVSTSVIGGIASVTQLIVSSGITTLGVTSATNLTSQQLNVSGISTLGVTSTTNLTAQQLNVSGISTLGVTSATNLTAQQLNVSGISTLGVTSATNLTSQQLNVSGITTLGVVTSGNIYSTGIVTATSFSGTLSGFASSAGIATYATNAGVSTYATNAGIATYATNAGVSTYATNAGVSTYATNAGIATYATNAGVSTYATNAGVSTYATNAGIATYATNAGVSTYATNAGVSTYATNAGVSTYATNAGIATYATNAGVSTYATNAGIATNVIGGIASVTQLIVSSGITTLGVVTSGNIYSTGIVTATRLSTGASGTGINIDTNTISGPSILYIDPAAIGNDTGAVRIKGDLYVDGTQFVVNSTTIELADFNVGIATTVGTNVLLDGAGIGIGSANIRKTFTYSSSPSDSLKSSENLDIASGKVYKIAGTEVLSSTQLTVANINASTGVTTLGVTSATNLTSQQLNVSGITTLGVVTSGNIYSTGIVTATSFSGTLSGFASSAGIATYATNAGIATYATNAGIATYATNAGVSTYATNAGIATYATNAGIATYATNAGIATYATNAGIATSVIGGIASVTQLIVSSGITTLGVVTSGNIYSTGVITATSFSGNASSATYATNAGIATYATNAGIATYATNAGIATYATNAGIATYATNAGVSTYATNAGIATYATNSGIATYATNAGIATYATNAGIATYATSSGIATYATNAGIATYATSAGIATYATNAGISTNLKGGVIGNIPYQSALDTTAFLTNGGSGTILQSNGIGATPTWVSAAPSNAITGLTIRDEGTTVGGANSVSTLNFVGPIVSAASTAGIATITFLDYVSNAGFATNAGISTNLKGGVIGNIPYQSGSDATVFLTNGGSGTILQSNGVGNTPSWVPAAPSNAISGLTIRDEGTIVGGANSVSTLNFVGPIVSVASTAGIATITFLDYVSNAGFATNAGIATYATNAGIATALQNSRTFEITGDIVASPISFNGTGNVSLAATIQPNSVALGSDTTGDYVQSITGTSNQISVSATSGEGSTPTLSIPNQFTIPQDAIVTRDLQVNRNLNVTGNITLGGTTAFLNVQELLISDPDIVLGFRTDAFGNDVSNDTTANHGGVALASTEGTPLVNLVIAGIETYPATYKKIMWFKSGTFAGLGTDAWLFNYAVGIGSTQFPNGTRLAAGNVQFTQDDLAVVRNINASGVITATSGFSGNASSATYATNAGIATNLKGGVIGNIPYQSGSDATVFLTNGGSGTILQSNGIGATPTWVTPAAANAITGLTIRDENQVVGSANSVSTLNFVGAIVSAASTAGIATITFLDYVSNAGFATNAGIATYATNAGIATYATNAGVSTSVIGGIGSITQLQVTGVSTFTNGPVLIGGGTSTGTAGQVLQVAGINSSVYIGGNLGVGNTNPGAKLDVTGDIKLSGADPEIEFNTGGPRLKVPTANTLTIHTGGGLNTTGSELVRINNTGVGINTTIPTSKLTVVGDATITNPGANALAVRSGASGSYANFNIGRTTNEVSISVAGNAGEFANNASAGDVVIRTDSTGKLLFTNGASNSTLAVAGNTVLVGTISSTGTASQPLQVSGGAYVSGSVGIGTTNPVGQLQVSTGPVIIGTSNSTGTANQPLQVSGSAYIAGDSNFVALGIGITNNTTYPVDIRLSSGANIPQIRISPSTNTRVAGIIYANVGSSNMFAGLLNSSGQTTNFTGGNFPAYAGMVGMSAGTSPLLLVTNALERVRVFDTGEVGIGTTVLTGTASQVLQVNGGAYVSTRLGVGVTNPATNTQVAIAGTFGISEVGGAGTRTLLSATSAGFVLNHNDNSNIDFRVLSTSKLQYQYSPNFWTIPAGVPFLVGTATSTGTANQLLRVEGGTYVSGFVGIGTTNPTSKLHVQGDVLVTGITTSNDFNSSSDINLKDNIQVIQNPIDKVLQLDGVTFNWKENNRPSVGVIAQQVEKVLPQLVGGNETKTVNYNGLIGLLIECVKEQQKEIDMLKERLT